MKSQKGNVLIIIPSLIAVVALAIAGYFFFQNQNLQKPKAETVTSNETANWKTYKNDDYKYEIKYPDNWNIKEIKSLTKLALITRFSTPSGNTLLEIRIRNGIWVDLQKYIEPTKAIKTTFNQIPAYIQGEGSNVKTYILPSKIDKQIVQIVYDASNSPQDEVKTLDQILGTFRFSDK